MLFLFQTNNRVQHPINVKAKNKIKAKLALKVKQYSNSIIFHLNIVITVATIRCPIIY